MEFLIPMVLFVCVAYTIKVVVDARVRAKMIAGNVSEELVRSMIKADDQLRRQSSLRWGVVLVCLAVGFGILESFHWEETGPGAVAILLAATGIGNLVSYFLSRAQPGSADAGQRSA